MSSSSSSLTSPSAPPPSTQFVPFDRLPFELVEDILHYTVPSYYHSETQSSLTTLALVDIEPEIDLAQLVQLRNLSSLRLAQITISASRFFILPQLRDLSLIEVIPDESCFSNLRQQSFPSLRAFASLEEHRTSPPSPLLSLFSLELFPQLDAIQLDEASVANFSTDFLDSIKHKTLFEYNCVFLDEDARSYKTPEYVRFAQCNWAYFDYIWSDISDWPEISIPSLIYFGLLFKPHGRTRTELERQLDYRSSLYDLCKRGKMEVVYEERGNDGEDHVISQDFWRRMRIKKLGKTRGVEEEE